MATGEGLRSEAITAALDDAIAEGRTRGAKVDRLYKLLCLASGLPGPRMNASVASAFASECAARGAKAEPLVDRMASLDPDEAPGATELEFLPVCGVLALGARVVRSKHDGGTRRAVLARLHDAAEDVRFRVREAAALALARVGGVAGDEVVREVAPWMDGFFQSAAVLHAMADQAWLSAIDDAAAAIARHDEAFALARDAPRSAVRWPGWKQLAVELGRSPAALATRFGVPVFDMLERWAATPMPELREVVEANLRDKKLGGRFHDEARRVRAALDASAPLPRDPTILVHGTRGRGKKRHRR